MSPLLAELLFLAPIIGVAAYHAQRFDRNIPTGKMFHFWWGMAFVPVIAGLWLLTGHNWLLAGALVVERFLIFGPALNFLRHPRKAFFYNNHGDSNSWQDRVLTYTYVPVYVVCVVGFIIIQFFL